MAIAAAVQVGCADHVSPSGTGAAEATGKCDLRSCETPSSAADAGPDGSASTEPSAATAQGNVTIASTTVADASPANQSVSDASVGPVSDEMDAADGETPGSETDPAPGMQLEDTAPATATGAASSETTSAGNESSTVDGTVDGTVDSTGDSTGDHSSALDERTADVTGADAGAGDTDTLGNGADASEPQLLPARIQDGPATLAADGVAVLTTIALSPDDVVSVELGGQPIDPLDGERVQWLPAIASSATSEATSAARMAVRAPSTLPAGTTTLRVLTKQGALQWPLEVIEPSGAFHPDSPLGIVWTSAAAGGVFPISTIAAGILIVDTEAGATADFTVQYRLRMRSAGDAECPIGRAGKGELYGEESVDIARFEQAGSPVQANEPYGDKVIHPIEGSYELHAEANFIQLTIDRTWSGGVVESYVGGWVSYPGNDNLLQPQLPAPSERAHPPPLSSDTAMAVLTSELTGRQLIMSRRLNDEEEAYNIRNCLLSIQ